MKTLVHRSRLRHTRRADDDMAVLPPLPPALSSLPLVASFYSRLSTASTLLAQIECLGDLKGTLSHNHIPVGAELSGFISLALSIAECVGCSSLLRPALTLLLAARAVCPQEVDRGLHAALVVGAGEKGATTEVGVGAAGVDVGVDGDAVAAEAAHRVFLWVALLEDGTLRARLLTPVLQGSHTWHATPLSLAMGAMDTSMGELVAMDWGRGTAPVVTLSACDAVTAALKLFSLLVSFIEGLGQGGFITEAGGGGEQASPSGAIGEHCKALLAWKECSQELRTAAAVALGAHWCSTAAAAAVLPSPPAAAGAASITEECSPLHSLCTFRGGVSDGGGEAPGLWVLTLPRASRLALVRGVLIAAPPALLLSTPTTAQPYLLTVWPQIEAALVSPDLGDRLSAVQLCETWLAALRRGVKADPSHALALATPTLLLVLKHLLLNWQSPTRRLTTLVSEVFQSLQTTLWALRVTVEGAGVLMPPQLTPQAQLEVAFDLPFGGVPWCHALQCIIRGGLKEGGGGGGGTTPTLHLLETHPTLLPRLMLLTCTELENSSLRSSTLSVVLCSARVELEVEAGLVGGEQGGAAQAWQKRGVATPTIAALRACFFPDSPSGKQRQEVGGGGGGEAAKKTRVRRKKKGEAGGPGASTLSQEFLSKYPTLSTHLAPWGTWNPLEGLGESGGGGVGGELEAEVVRVDQEALMSSLKGVLGDGVGGKEGEGESEEEGGWVVQVYRECAHASVYFAWLHLWLPHTLALLVDPRRDVRMRGDAFIAREGVGMDSWTWGIVHKGLGGLIGGAAGGGGRGDDGCTLSERAIAGMVAILKTARSAGYPALECDGEAAGAGAGAVGTQQQQQLVPLSTVQQWGCTTPDPDVRVSVMELLASAQTSSGHPPTGAEYLCTASVFASNTTLPLWELRKRATRAFSKFLARALTPRVAWAREEEKRATKKATATAAASKGGKKSSTAQALGGVREEGVGGVEVQEMHSSPPPDLTDLSRFLSTTTQAMVSSLYPGSPLERASLALSLLTAAAEALPPSPPLPGEAVSIAAALDPALASPRVASYLINLLGDPQESLRSSAGALLIGHCGERGRGCPSQPSPSPFPGIDSPQSLEGVLVYALRLTSSLRDRESGAGAALLHAIFLRYVCELGWELTLYPQVQVRTCTQKQQSTPGEAVATFLTQLHAVLQARVRALRGAMGELLGLGEGSGGVGGDAAALTVADPSHAPPHPPTPHGVALALRLCCLSAMGKGGGGGVGDKGVGTTASSPPTLPSILSMVLGSLEELMQLSLLAVAGGGDSDGGLEMSSTADNTAVIVGGEEGEGVDEQGEESEEEEEEEGGEEEEEGDGEGEGEGEDGADESVLASGRVDCSAGGKVWAKGLLRHLRPKSEVVGAGGRSGGATSTDPPHKSPQLHGPVSNSVGAYVGGGGGGGAGVAGGDLHSALRGTSGTAVVAPLSPSSSPSTTPTESREVSLPHAVIVACWLASREGTRAREGILNALPLPIAATAAAATGAPTPEVFTQTLWGFLRALLTLRHVGSIAAVTSAVQTLVGRLLTAPSIHPKLSKWPSQALTALLQALMGAKEFILRRSAGFGFAFLAILRSEPRNATAQLLPRAINTLLAMAGCPVSPSVGGGEEGKGKKEVRSPRPRPRTVIHALNILCLLFKDSSLGEACSRFLYPALATALLGFSSPSWAIRNSSMMLFAAVSDRALGTEGKNTGASPPATLLRHGGKDTRTLASEFFSRNPPILAPLLKHLEQGVAPSGAAGAAPLATAPLHPQLFPVLLLFSRLQGGVDGSGEDGEVCAPGHPLAPLLPLLLPLLSHRHSFIRGLAGGVVASIPHPKQAVEALSQALLQGMGGGSSSSSSSNACHGALTATRTLVSRVLCQGCANPIATLAPLRLALLSFAQPLLASPTALPLLKAEALLALYEVAVGGGEGGAGEVETGMTCKGVAHQAGLCTLPLTGPGAKGIGGGVFTRAAGGVALHLSLLKCIKQGKCGAGALSPLTHPHPDTRQGAWKTLKTALKHHTRLLPQGIAHLFTVPSSTPPTSMGEELFALALGGEGWGGAAKDAVPIINSYRLHTVALLAPYALSSSSPSSTVQGLIQHPKSWGFSLAVCALGSRVDAKVRLHALSTLGYLLSAPPPPALAPTPTPPAVAVALSKCVEAAVKELCGVGGVGGVGGDREASTHHTLRAKALGALGRSGVLRCPWTHPTTPTATLALGTAWPALLLALTDGDDEVREGARVVVLDALSGAGSAVVSYTLVSMASGEFVRGAPREVGALLPIPPPIAASEGTLQGLCDRGALLAAHVALTLACALGGEEACSLVGAMCRATLMRCFEGGLVGVAEVGEAVAKVAAAAPPPPAVSPAAAAAGGDFDPSMLHRATFLPCSTANGFAEDLLLCGLAGGLWVHLHKKGVPSVVGKPLTPIASSLIQGASSMELPTHPFLTHTQGWTPEGACVDHFPAAFAPCRVAECVVAGEAEGGQ